MCPFQQAPPDRHRTSRPGSGQAALRAREIRARFWRGRGTGVAVNCTASMAADVLADVRYSLRSLTRTPVWTAALVLTIALGIGTSASVQGFVRGLLTTDLPIFAIERVVTVFETDSTGASGPVSIEVFTALSERRDVFESLAAIRESQERVSINARSTLMSVAAY